MQDQHSKMQALPGDQWNWEMWTGFKLQKISDNNLYSLQNNSFSCLMSQSLTVSK